MNNVKVWSYFLNDNGLRSHTEWTTHFDDELINHLFRFHNASDEEREKLGLTLAIAHGLTNVLDLQVSHVLTGWEMDRHNGCGGFVSKKLLGVGYEAKTYLVSSAPCPQTSAQ